MDKKNIVVCSLNVNGLSKDKICYLKDFLMPHGVDIIFLQETHADSCELISFFERVFLDFEIFTERCVNKTKGTAILVKKISDLSVFGYECYNNRIVCVKLKYKNEEINLVNIYAPNSVQEQIEFIEELNEILHQKKRVILGGDFNFVENDQSDRYNVRKSKFVLKRNVKEWVKLFNIMNLEEASVFEESDHMRTMSWTNGIQSSRIDRLYTKSHMKENLFYIGNEYFSMSDHRLILAKYNFENQNHLPVLKKNNFNHKNEWKLNENVLNEESVHKEIMKKCEENYLYYLKKKHENEWYEVFIGSIIKMLKRESRILSDKRKERLKSLFYELKELDKSDRDEKETQNERLRLRNEISNYYKEKREGHEKRACEIKRKFAKQPSKILIEKEMRNNKINTIEKYKCADESVTNENDKIIEEVSKFYKNLLGEDRVKKKDLENYEFLIRKIEQEDREEFLSGKITYYEAEEVVKNLKEAAPGPNGLTCGFYKKYFKFFGKNYVDLLNNTKSKLSKSFNEVVIKLIPKNKKETKSIDDLRPISLTNYEYRIFTKILCNRLQNINHKIISDNQTCSINGRRMNDNIVLLRDLIFDCKLRKRDLNIISVDQKKAFDSVSHGYLFKILEHLGLGDFMIDSIKRLYESSYACVSINKIKSESFDIKSGIKQGCSLSMMLYVIVIEELLLRIESNENIKGYKIKVLFEYEIKATAYADDVVGYTTDDASTEHFFNEFEKWGLVSGAQINKKKTQFIKINKDNNFQSESIKILGVLFNENGLCKSNYDQVKNKIMQAIEIWKRVRFSMLDRIVVCKTFLLSKLWFLSQFYVFQKNQIKELNSLIFKFIWNNSIELAKRDVIILPKEKGGLGMFHLKAKFECILFQQYLYIIRSYERKFYCMSLYWLKFKMRELEIKNFNIIPSGADKDRPIFYDKVIESLNLMKKFNKNFMSIRFTLNSKKCYEIFRMKYEKRPNCETNFLKINWEEVYKKTLCNKLESNMITLNFKILNNSLEFNMKFNNRKKISCFLCGSHVEDLDHLFVSCRRTADFFYLVEKNFKNKLKLNFQTVFFHYELIPDDSRMISIFKLSIWTLRNSLRISVTKNIENLFINLFNNFMKE